MRRPITIGQLAKEAGVGIETIRYYQRRGLLETPRKPPTGRRLYPEAMQSRIAFIRRAQYLGFSLEEIKALLRISDGSDCSAGRAHAQSKYDELGERIRELTRMRRKLHAIVKRCESNKRGAPCAFMQVLNGLEN
jgi:MerR family mercuric resistance operon transcriptional regulator